MKKFKVFLQERLDRINFVLKYTNHSKRKIKLLKLKKIYEKYTK